MKNLMLEFKWILPISISLGVLIGFVSPGNWLIGWLIGSLMLFTGLIALAAAWRWAGGGRILAWMLALAVILRLAAGVALYLYLPVAGYDTEQQRAGYVFYDAWRRDTQSWDLARSNQPIWNAFNKKFYTDQYGGLLALSALIYRYLSPDAHRPLLIVLVAALTAALGVPFFWRAARAAWGEKVVLPAAWVFALYPESILQGSSQMREPFLITFIAITFWGFMDWQASNNRRTWLWVGIGLAGMLLISPGIVLVTLAVLAGWSWLSTDDKRVSWQVLLLAGIVFLIGILLLAWGVGSQSLGTKSPPVVLAAWFKDSVSWTVYQLERGSGWVQKLFNEMGTEWQLLFVVGYGFAQPVLPAAFIEPTTIIWRLIAILRSAGWYILAPLLIYGSMAAWKTPQKRERKLWLWLCIVTWFWITVSALRAGGDQWDNPRYRVILLAWQALVAGYAWTWWREHREAWVPRLLVIEGISLGFFTQWYISRYYHILGQIPFWLMVSLILGISVLILFGGWLWDLRKGHNRQQT
jgi:hypothetical protein